jgi:phosphoribosyl-ATP pyrophosphohydrolase
MVDSVDRLYQAAVAAMNRDPAFSRTAKLFRDGIDKMAKKLAEEAVEVGIEAIRGKEATVVQESADVMYQLCVLWAAMGITPQDVWNEMDRRERLYGIAEKLPKSSVSERLEDNPVSKMQARLRTVS